MLPNPQDALPLPLRPSVEQFRKLAKDLVKAGRSANRDALAAFCDRWIAALSKVPSQDGGASNLVEDLARRHFAKGCNLAGAQFVIARSHGFVTWARFMKFIDRLARGDEPFEIAADVVVAGDEAALRDLVATHPALARAKSDREHGGTLPT